LTQRASLKSKNNIEPSP
jgi:hypothetical protein